MAGTIPNASFISAATTDSTSATGQPATASHHRTQTLSGRSRRGHGPHHSHSKHHASDSKSPGEYALHHLVNSFVSQAESKINQSILNSQNFPNPVEQTCGPGGDPAFDRIISALGHIVRQNPKPLVDTLMLWRKKKGDQAASITRQAGMSKFASGGGTTITALPSNGLPIGLPRRNTEPVQPATTTPEYQTQNHAPSANPHTPRNEDPEFMENRATVSIYLVCRVLIQIFQQSSFNDITQELYDRLEDIIYTQLKGVDPLQLSMSHLRMANWRIYGQLLGHMSNTNFVSVTSKMLTDVENLQNGMIKNNNGSSSRDIAGRLELLLMGMRHVRIKTLPDRGWNDSCDFLRALARLFVNAKGHTVKLAYCSVFERYLTTVASDPSSDLSAPKWKDFLDIISPRINQLVSKPHRWNVYFPLSALVVCVSPKEVLMGQWNSILSGFSSKIRDRSSRSLILQALGRLAWIYIYRVNDPLSVATRKLEELLKTALPQGKKTQVSTEKSTAEPLIQLLRIIGFKYQDLCFRTVVFPLMNSEMFASSKELKIEQMEPEKMVIGIRSFLRIISDLEKGEKGLPPFPPGASSFSVLDNIPTSPLFQMTNAAEGLTLRLDDQSSATQPVDLSALSDTARQFYLRFCDILGKITIQCDIAFGGQAALNERFGCATSKTPLTDTFGFGRKDDSSNVDYRQGFYELLHVAVQALPRCVSEFIPFTSLINLLCTGTAHVQTHIAYSSAQSLKSIARQSHAQQVAIGFARFIFAFDNKYSTMTEEGLLGLDHIENTLTLYIELLQIWKDELKEKTSSVHHEPLDRKDNEQRGLQLDLSSMMNHVDEIESHGLFFLCSQSRRVRAYAVRVLRIVTEFDQALGKNNARIIHILEDDKNDVLELNDNHLNVAERSRLQKGKRKSTMPYNTLIEICSSEVSYDSTLWSKAFPNLIRAIYEACPNAVYLSRDTVCTRLLQMQQTIEELSGLLRNPSAYNAAELRKQSSRVLEPSNEILVEQWKLYLITACVTLSSAGAQSQSQLANAAHARKVSKNSQFSPEKLASARSLFAAVIPLLGSYAEVIRSAVVTALGSINLKLYRTLLESLQYAVIKCNDEAKQRAAAHHRSPSSPARSKLSDSLRTEVAHVYRLTSQFLRDSEMRQDDWILNNLVNYTKDLRIFLSDSEVQNDWDLQQLRIHYCGLMEEVFDGINRSADPARWMPFESRKSAFTLMEDWCGCSPNLSEIPERDKAMRQIAMSQHIDGERNHLTAAVEIQKKNLRNAALSAMASLCAGPVMVTTESKAVLQFHVPRMLSWIGGIFATMSDKLHLIGRRALKNLIAHNQGYPSFMDHAIERCYVSESPKAFESYFAVVTDILILHPEYPVPFWRILALVLFTLGTENQDIRMKSARLLRNLEEREQFSSKLQDFDIGISDKTTVVYKRAQFEYSRRLSIIHGEMAFTIFSEFALHFRSVSTDHQRILIAAILPWIQAVELQIDPNGGPTAASQMLLSNLLEITIRLSNVLHNEVQALWQALGAGPHAGNVQLALDFIINLCLERREQNFVDHARQIVVYLSGTAAGSKVIEFFLLQMVPKNMVFEKKAPEKAIAEQKNFPYFAELGSLLPMGNRQNGFSLGHLSLIFLVDLIVAPIDLSLDHAVKIIHVTLMLWDHHLQSVRDQAREMLVHLIHELVTSKIDDTMLNARKGQIEELVDCIRKGSSCVVWSYSLNADGDEDNSDNRVPMGMANLTKQVGELFLIAFDGLRDAWAKEALGWASSCPVRHLACRSFQIFRCISLALDSRMLADMLARLSNTIADEEADYQNFSLEILTTLKVIIASLNQQDLLHYPQLFWTICACLNTIHEQEFLESLAMLEKWVTKVDIGDPAIVSRLMDNRPPKWEGEFDGLDSLLYKGLKSSDSYQRTLTVLDRLIGFPDNELTGPNTRYLYSLLAILPQLAHSCDTEAPNNFTDQARRYSKIATARGLSSIASSLESLATRRLANGREFLKSMTSGLQDHFFPQHDSHVLVFLMGFLTNQSTWFRTMTADLLCLVIPLIDMRRPEISSHGPDLISPLLRLLTTSHIEEALKVMDHIMEVFPNPNERQHLRMSMTTGRDRSVRKEYEHTKSLYGIPEPSGWSIPMPAVYSARTRNNVHAVFYTCADIETMEAQAAATPEIEFRSDDYAESYFPTNRTGTMKSVDTSGSDHNIGDLVQKLDSLDDFFNEPLNISFYHATSIPGFSNDDLHENGTNIYDQQTAPILRKSLNRTASTSSFRDGLAESRPLAARDASIMTPTAFASGSASADQLVPNVATASPSARPALHSRSITSPANHLPTSRTTPGPVPLIPNLADGGGSFLSDDEYDEREVALSDSETPFPALAATSSLPLHDSSHPLPILTGPSSISRQAPITDGPFSLGTMKSRMRRLTGGKGDRDRDRQRDIKLQHKSGSLTVGGQSNVMASSPRVPRVPHEYLMTNSPTSPGI
ncbi:MAG: hypothetical protein Q9160_001590 [Pyrenula sp. 1 TL-2023]